MTPDDLQRLARLEERDLTDRARLDRMEAKLDKILTAANMGQGAWLLMLKVGGLIAAVAAVSVAVVTAVEKLITLLKH